MPYKNPDTKRQKNLEYKAIRRSLLSRKEKARRARKLMEDEEGYRAKEREAGRIRRAKIRTDPDLRKRRNAWANERYHNKLRDDPDYQAKARAKAKAWRVANKQRYKQSVAKCHRANLNYQLAMAVRRRFYMAHRKCLTGGEAIRNLGCSILELRVWLAERFLPGMTWENYGIDGWHIDHVRPLASFDLTQAEDVKAACHYTNLQPLWAVDNIAKGAN